jgi:hypothetical protein
VPPAPSLGVVLGDSLQPGKRVKEEQELPVKEEEKYPVKVEEGYIVRKGEEPPAFLLGGLGPGIKRSAPDGSLRPGKRVKGG